MRQLLKGAAPRLMLRRMARKQQQGRLGGLRGAQGGCGIGKSGSAADAGHPALPGQPSPGVGHVHRGGFVSDVNERHAAVEQRIKERHDVIAG